MPLSWFNMNGLRAALKDERRSRSALWTLSLALSSPRRGSLGGLMCCALCGTVVAGGMENMAHARSMDIGERYVATRSKYFK